MKWKLHARGILGVCRRGGGHRMESMAVSSRASSAKLSANHKEALKTADTHANMGT